MKTIEVAEVLNYSQKPELLVVGLLVVVGGAENRINISGLVLCYYANIR